MTFRDSRLDDAVIDRSLKQIVRMFLRGCFSYKHRESVTQDHASVRAERLRAVRHDIAAT